MSSALFGILQLDRGDPLGYANVTGLIQAWLQDAGGFAMVGLVVYLLYALATPTDKSQSEKIRVPVTQWMVWMAALALVCYALVAGTFAISAPTVNLFGREIVVAPPEIPPPPPGTPVIVPPPTFHTELRPLLFMFAGLFALLGIGQPFARDLVRIAGRNLSAGFTGVRRFGHSVSRYANELLTVNRVIALGIALAVYAAIGVAVYAFGSPRLFGIWTGVCIVGLTVFLLALFVLMLFEAEGPVWAIGKLSFKEAVRSQLLWVFLIIFLPFLFPAQWFVSIKPADELRTTVGLIGAVLTFLVLFPALLLASFGIPNDIKNLNIYTVVSKPVERFEIVLGRFVGYVSLMTLVLVGLTGVSLVLIMNSSISEKAREETYKARVPIRGTLEFASRRADFAGTNVGREFDYRKYIYGHEKSPERAIWHFADIPAELATAEGDRVPVEFTFDIFKLTKGEQNKGVDVNFRFVTHHAPQQRPTTADTGNWLWQDRKRQEEYENLVKKFEQGGRVSPEEAERFKKLGGTVTAEPNGTLTLQVVKLGEARPGTPAWDILSKLAEEFGFYEIRGKQVLDYTVMGVEVPAGIFRNARTGDPGKEAGKDGKEHPRPRLSIYVKCESGGQLLGMAEPDLYLLAYEQPFALNYIKGMVGLWCRLCIVVGLAVACSTYLSGVLSLLVAATIFLTGYFTDHLNDVALNRSVGGGPFESMSRLVQAQMPTAPTPETTGAKALGVIDQVVAWGFRRVQNIIPDVESFSWSNFVAEGFNINGEYLVVNLLVTFGYLLPWAILAYYLMKSREVAA
jgi:hypothetical protein